MRINLFSIAGSGVALAALLASALPIHAETTSAADPATDASKGAAAEQAAEAPSGSSAASDLTDGPVPDALMAEGETLFLRNCRQCHGSRGTAGVPLKANEKLADVSYVTSVILMGPGYMAAFADALNDEQIAAIATYVRNSWDNDYGVVTPQDVADMR